MQRLWKFDSSRLGAYSNLTAEAEPVRDPRKWAGDGESKGFEEISTANESQNGGLRPIYTRIALLLLAFICALETSALILQHYLRTWELRPLIRSPVSPVQWEVREFANEPSLRGHRTTADVEAAWKQLNLPDAGFVYLPHPTDYGLLPNTDVVKGAENVYSVSAYHQLHCLKVMHLTFVELWSLEEGDERMSLEHIEHCISYIKQGIMCAGDTALEGPDVGGGTLQGWGTKHECRTWGGENGIAEQIDVLNEQMVKQQEACKAAGRC